MKNKTLNSSVFTSVQSLTALQKKASMTRIPRSNKQALSGVGSTKSPFKTKGMDFSEIRQYQAGDDIRQIDWRVTAKYGKPFTKLYTDEKQRPVFLLCDLRTSMKFATQGDFKSVIAAKITAFLAWLAESKGELIKSMLILPDGIRCLPPGQGKQTVLALIKELSIATNPVGLIPDLMTLEQATNKLGAFVGPGSLLFVCSDFHDLTPTTIQHFVRTSDKATLSFIHIFDKMEEKMPDLILPVTDGTHVMQVDMTDKKNRKLFTDSFMKTQRMLTDAANTYGFGYLSVRTDESYLAKIARYCEGIGS